MIACCPCSQGMPDWLGITLTVFTITLIAFICTMLWIGR